MPSLSALARRIATEQASSRAVAIVRVFVPLLLWTRFGSDLAFFSRPWTPGDIALRAVFFVATTAMLVGAWSRAACLVTGGVVIALSATRGAGPANPFAHHHVTLLVAATLLLALTPCDRSLSLDRLRAQRRGEDVAERGLVYGQWLLRVLVSSLYLCTAIDKTNVAFLTGERMQHYVHFHYLGSADHEGVLVPVLACAAAIASVTLEYALGLFLWLPRARRVLLPLGLVFHAIIYLTLPVHTFSLTMALLYVIVIDPDALHAAIDRHLGR